MNPYFHFELSLRTFRQLLYSRLAGYEELNDAVELPSVPLQ